MMAAYGGLDAVRGALARRPFGFFFLTIAVGLGLMLTLAILQDAIACPHDAFVGQEEARHRCQAPWVATNWGIGLSLVPVVFVHLGVVLTHFRMRRHLRPWIAPARGAGAPAGSIPQPPTHTLAPLWTRVRQNAETLRSAGRGLFSVAILALLAACLYGFFIQTENRRLVAIIAWWFFAAASTLTTLAVLARLGAKALRREADALFAREASLDA